uniref:Cytochrome-b5 reductase n=1 Tax=Arcella intermedia TaxID=1963864 RepID=A0A6B2L7X9_9EUKA
MNKKFAPVPGASASRVVTWEELRMHSKPDDCWTVVRGVVYNITDYVYYHPGGAEELLRGAGRDCTELYDEFHSWVNERNYMSPIQVVGVIEKEKAIVNKRLNVVHQGARSLSGGSSGEFISAVITDIKPINYNSKQFTFKLDKKIHMELGVHLKLIGGSGTPVIRPYTPINGPGEHDVIEFVVKLYPDGRMSRYLSKCSIGSSGKFKTCKNKFTLPQRIKQIGIIAGGAGIAPMIPIIDTLLKKRPAHHYYDDIHLTLLYSNVVKEDILLKEKFDLLAQEHPERLKVIYTLTNPDVLQDWNGEKGRIDKEKIVKYLPQPAASSKILVCGPVVMTNAMDVTLHQIGYTDDMIHLFI